MNNDYSIKMKIKNILKEKIIKENNNNSMIENKENIVSSLSQNNVIHNFLNENNDQNNFLFNLNNKSNNKNNNTVSNDMQNLSYHLEIPSFLTKEYSKQNMEENIFNNLEKEISNNNFLTTTTKITTTEPFDHSNLLFSNLFSLNNIIGNNSESKLFFLLQQPYERQRKSYNNENRYIRPTPLIITLKKEFSSFIKELKGKVNVSLVNSEGKELDSKKRDLLQGEKIKFFDEDRYIKYNFNKLI